MKKLFAVLWLFCAFFAGVNAYAFPHHIGYHLAKGTAKVSAKIVKHSAKGGYRVARVIL